MNSHRNDVMIMIDAHRIPHWMALTATKYAVDIVDIPTFACSSEALMG